MRIAKTMLNNDGDEVVNKAVRLFLVSTAINITLFLLGLSERLPANLIMFIYGVSFTAMLISSLRIYKRPINIAIWAAGIYFIWIFYNLGIRDIQKGASAESINGSLVLVTFLIVSTFTAVLLMPTYGRKVFIDDIKKYSLSKKNSSSKNVEKTESVMHPIQKEALIQLQAEFGIPDDWSAQAIGGALRYMRSINLAAEDIARMTGHDRSAIFECLLSHSQMLEAPEGSDLCTFTSPDGQQTFFAMATPRDQKMGTTAYLDRLNHDQLRYARAEADSRIKAKTQEAKRTVWRVCDDSMCRGNFRDDDYLGAVAFMAAEGKRLHAEHSDRATSRDRDLKLELVPMRVPESEYESYFTQ